MKNVYPVGGEVLVRASDMDEIERFTEQLALMNIHQKAVFHGIMLGEGIMFLKGWQARMINSWVKLVSRFKKMSLSQGWIQVNLIQVKRGKPGFIEDGMTATIDHMLHGKDTEDADSAGGLSQRELQLAVNAWVIINAGLADKLIQYPDLVYGMCPEDE